MDVSKSLNMKHKKAALAKSSL